jgi:hypothetical protein
MGKGIDYGLGRTNVDVATGIRFGVINANSVDFWHESNEGRYGDPACPECGGDVTDDTEEMPSDASGDYYCADCEECRSSDEVFPESPVSWVLDDGEYLAEQGGEGDDCDVFVIKSPYFTRAAFCSPCAPGACYLGSPCDDGERAYCFGPDFFEDGKAPYPIYSVATGELVSPKEDEQ